jgi:choline-sulfatase
MVAPRLASFLAVVFGALICATPALAQAKPAKSAVVQTKPDLILVTIDTLRADHVGCYGYTKVKTPNLDGLCREGTQFTNAFTASPITNTSHASIMTGLYPSHHGVTDFGVPLAANHITLAQVMKRGGYRTGAFIGAVILDSKTLAVGFDRGFDYYDNFPTETRTKERWGRVERRGGEVVAHAISWLKKQAGAPVFMWVHLYDPHDPYEPPEPFATQYKDRPYDGEIAYADQCLGKLLTALKQAGRYDHAVIAVMGDHGEGLGEHGENTHGIFLYDSTTHIPLVIRALGRMTDGVELGHRVIQEVVSSVDVAPWLMDLLDLRIPEKYAFSDKNSSLRALLRRKIYLDIVFSETDYPLRFGWAPLKSVQTRGMKYIEAPRAEFYDLKADPSETNNIYAPWNEDVMKLRATMALFRQTLLKAQSTTNASVDPNTIEELKALGYLGTNPGATTAPDPSVLPDPKDKIAVQNFIHAGMMAEDGGDASVSRQAFQKAIALDPDSVVPLSQLGQLEFKAGDYKAAAAHLSKAYSLRPEDAVAALTLGRTLEKTGDTKAAALVLEQAVKASSGQYEARVALGRVRLALHDLSAAQDQLEAATLIDGKRPEAHIELARVYLAMHKPQLAQGELRKAEAAAGPTPETTQLKKEAQ